MAIFTQLKNLFVFLFIKNLFKIIFVIVFSVLFFVILFPKNELSDFISKTVADQTRNQVNLAFEDMSFTSNLGVQLDQVFFEMAGRPPITLKELIASPDLMAALNRKPYGRIKMTGLFNGDSEISVSKHKSENGDNKADQSMIAVTANQVDLMGLKSFLKLPFEMHGRADLNTKAISIFQLTPPTDGTAQPPFTLVEIPELTLTVKNFDMPPFTLEQGMALPFNVPGLKLSEIVLKARLYDNTFQIQELQLGRANDELSGTIKGNITMMKGPMMMPEGYEITTDLKMRQSFHDKISLLLPILNANRFVTPFAGGYSFKSKVSWRMGRAMPSFDSAR
ncbi:MAG: type II secretion system protein GspN [Bdellovibrio sp. 28-41-41]|nr:MAG: type II secretion system protein GspN [Bdellovibrio sp. 28-41-41]